jgi:hypothetical protein
LSDPTKPFSQPTSGLWVNGLWFSSLVISLTCALLATLLQQWARRYLRVAYPRRSPDKRARLRAFYKHGVEKLHVPWTVEVLPALLHISLFLFFAGLSVFLSGVHPTIFKVVTVWIGLCAFLYVCLTFLPIICKDSPYCAPLSAPFSFCLTGIGPLFVRLFQKLPCIISSIRMPLHSRDPKPEGVSHGMTKTAEEFAFKLDPGIDYRSLFWTFRSLDEDSDFEKFFEALPRLCDSETGKELKLQRGFIEPNEKKLSTALIGLMNRTLSSNLVTEFVKQRRMIICTKVIESTSLLGPWWILRSVLLGGWYRFLGCVEFGLFVQNWRNISHKVTTFYAQCVAALTVSIVRRDERWYQLAIGLLDTSRSLLHKYIAHGDSILLANVMFIIRRTVQTYSGSADRHKKDVLGASSRTLETVCKLDIRRTLPELQHEFCDLWNQLVDAAQNGHRPDHHVYVSTMTLKNIRKLFIALHGTQMALYTTDDRDPILDNPMSYPRCTIGGHRHSLPIPDLQFDDPDPDAASGPPTPNISRMPTPTIPYAAAWPSAFITPLHAPSPQAPYSALAALSQYGAHFVDPLSHLAGPPFGPTIPFPRPPSTHSHASTFPRGNVQSLPPSHKSASSVPSIHVVRSSGSLGGQSTRTI